MNCFSEIYEKYLHGQLASYVYKFLSENISVYRKSHNTNHTLVRLIENWRKNLDNNLVIGMF